jgi:hypothetical protein
METTTNLFTHVLSEANRTKILTGITCIDFDRPKSEYRTKFNEFYTDAMKFVEYLEDEGHRVVIKTKLINLKELVNSNASAVVIKDIVQRTIHTIENLGSSDAEKL